MLHRLLWWLGLNLPPPLFQRFVTVLALETTSVSLFLMAGFTLFSLAVPPLEFLLYVGLGSGLVYGFLRAVYFASYASNLNLPSWEEYVPGADESEAELDW